MGIYGRLAKRKPKINKYQAKLRVKFAQKYIHQPLEFW